MVSPLEAGSFTAWSKCLVELDFAILGELSGNPGVVATLGVCIVDTSEAETGADGDAAGPEIVAKTASSTTTEGNLPLV